MQWPAREAICQDGYKVPPMVRIGSPQNDPRKVNQVSNRTKKPEHTKYIKRNHRTCYVRAPKWEPPKIKMVRHDNCFVSGILKNVCSQDGSEMRKDGSKMDGHRMV